MKADLHSWEFPESWEFISQGLSWIKNIDSTIHSLMTVKETY